MSEPTAAKRQELLTSHYRYIVVPHNAPFYGVRDRATGWLIREDLTRREARALVRSLNSDD